MFSLLLGFNLALALTFAIALTMLVTSLRLWLKVGHIGFKPVGNATVRVFKGQQATVELDTRSSLAPTSAVTLDVIPPAGVEASASMAPEGRLEVKVRPRYAGLFLGLAIALGVKDELGLFVAEKSVSLETFRVESMPTSLVAGPRTSLASWMLFAETPADVKGHGQEVYSIEEASESEARSIYWKRVARSPEERLTVISREAGLASSVALGVIDARELGIMRLGWMDLATEALARLGCGLLEIGADVEILASSASGLRRMRASTLPQLVQCVMKVWEGAGTNAQVQEVARLSDVIIVDSGTAMTPVISRLLAGKATLAISSGGEINLGEANGYTFSGTEDLDGLILEVLRG